MRLRKKKSLIDQASDYIETLRPQVESAVASATETVRTTALPMLADARDKAGPALAEARERVAPLLVDARDKAAPYLADAREKAGERAALGRDLANAKVAQLKGEPVPKKGSKLKKIALFVGIAAAVGFVAKKLQGGGASENWQSSYVPAPPPKAATPSAVPPDDASGSSPDEAIADQAETTHPVTTPDDPAEVVAIDDEK